MASSKNPDRLSLGYLPRLTANQPISGSSTANSSPIESGPGNPLKSAFGGANGLGAAGSAAGASRMGAGSPSHELGGRYFPKRAREIQAQERITSNPWGPPTSGHSTPLRENIPESPTDGFPDFKPTVLEPPPSTSPPRRMRAGTLPSRLPPSGTSNGSIGPQLVLPEISRPAPVGSPFQLDNRVDRNNHLSPASASNVSSLLSRLRSGSMPQRNSYVGPAGPFGPSLFSTSWSTGRERATTLTSIGSGNGPNSPAQSSFSKDGAGDNEMRTLDYLGLADTPQPARAALVNSGIESLLEGQQSAALQPFLADLANLNRNLNRFRSYSVNAKEKYAEEEEEELGHMAPYSGQHSGSLTPSAASAAAALAATQAQIHQHNLAVQAFANQASASRPRARTAGVLESPVQRSVRNYLATPSRLDNSITAADLRLVEAGNFEGLAEAVQSLQLGSLAGHSGLDGGNFMLNDGSQETPTRALWLGSIPSSTTVTSLNAIFGIHGKIESARVLTHKNCGFVNFENAQSAIQAKTLLNGKEIFPGAGPVRIGYAKVPDGSAAGTPGANGLIPSPSPDPFGKGQGEVGMNGQPGNGRNNANGTSHPQTTDTDASTPVVHMSQLRDVRADMLRIVTEFGAMEDEQMRIAAAVDQAVRYYNLVSEIPAVPEPSQTRVHDAPKLREIRKRIDNNACSQAEIEEIAIGMLPELAELSSDYLGNTVVQKLFEFCTEAVKQSMLTEVAQHLAEIGVHKNGTWAAQRIIDVAKTPTQMSMIVENLRPYTIPLFLDQYGNYVLQCVLRFGSPWNDFIFETMISRMAEISQGRFGARAMRACLESHHATKAQQRMLAAAISIYSVQLSTNANGALLLTWLLDTCTFLRRRAVLAQYLIPHLVQLCTHKVAYLTVLKVINQRSEPDARDAILNALFFAEDDKQLEEILQDSGCGATLIFKVLTTPFFEERIRSDVVQKIRNVLIRLKAQPAQGYKRLMDEVGLSTRSGNGSSGPGRDHHGSREGSLGPSSSQDRHRPGSRHRTPNSRTPQPPMEGPYNGQYLAPGHSLQLDPNSGVAGLNNLDAASVSNFHQYGMNGINNPMFPNSNIPITPATPQQIQFQPALLASAPRPMTSGSIYPGMPPGIGTFPTSSPALDAFRANPANGPAMVPPTSQMSGPPMYPQGGYTSPAFNQMMAGQMMAGGYQFQPMNGMPFVGQAQQQHAGNRRGRQR